MQLISLSANQPSFKTVYFRNPVGLNFIVAEKKGRDLAEEGNTSNGVGKSLLISIIDFCLGSDSRKEFKAHLKGWSFTLKFAIGSEEHEVTRFADRQDGVVRTGKAQESLKEYRKWLERQLFDLPPDVELLSFRTLIAFFLRPRKISYSDAIHPVTQKSEIAQQLANAFLLGLPIDRAMEKLKDKKRKDEIKGLLTELKKDPTFREFTKRSSKKDVEITLRELNDRVAQTEQKLAAFTVAEDYHERKLDADKITEKLQVVSNELIIIGRQISSIDESMLRTPDVKRTSIEQVYAEASAAFKVETLKTLKDLELFYNELATTREKRLLQKKYELQAKQRERTTERESLEKGLDKILEYLNIHQSLDLFVSLNKQLTDIKIRAERLRSNHELYQSNERKVEELEAKRLEANLLVSEQLQEANVVLERIRELFHQLGKRLYPKAGVGISVANNLADSQTRYDIQPIIDSDTSDGISKMVLFCYDLAILLKGYGHHVKFLFHDSRLLSDTDPEQIVEVFRILDEYVLNSGKQYILSLNSFQLEDIRASLGQNEFDRIVTQNIVLTIKEGSPEEKLLGLQINFDHEN